MGGDMSTKPVSIPETPEAPVTPQTNIPPEKTTIFPLHTLKDDMHNVVQGQNMSIVHAMALEQQKRMSNPRDSRNTAPKHLSILLPVLIITSLVIVSIASLIGIIYVERLRSTPQQISDSSIVFSEKTVAIKINGSQSGMIKIALANALKDTSDSQGSITRVMPQTSASTTDVAPQEATLPEFFTALGINPPSQLIRSLSGKFFFGFHTLDRRYPIFVLPVISYDNAVAGMLDWEKSIDQDLSPIYTLVPTSKLNDSGVPIPRTFTHTIMYNADVRVLTNDAGVPVLYYSFPSPTILIIAENPYTFPEIISRLQAQREL